MWQGKEVVTVRKNKGNKEMNSGIYFSIVPCLDFSYFESQKKQVLLTFIFCILLCCLQK